MSTDRQPRAWTYADLDRLPEVETGNRYEIINGELVVTPSPGTLHASLTTELIVALGGFVQDGDRGYIFPARVDVLLADDVVLIPDLFFIRRERRHIIGSKAIEGPPDLVVEILSPVTRARDLGVKMELYRHFRVMEYWLLDPEARTLAMYALMDGRYEVISNAAGIARSRVLAGLEIDVAMLFAAAEI